MNRLKRKAIIIIALSVISTVFSVNIFADSNSVSDTPDISEFMIKQEKALLAYEELCTYFDTDENGCYIYPDNYAGEYINDSGDLVVLYTEINDDLTFLYSIDNITLEEVPFSLNELNEDLEKTKKAVLNTNNYTIARAGIDVIDNVAFLDVSPISEHSNMSVVSTYEQPESTVVINVVETNFVTQGLSIPGGSGIDTYWTNFTLAANGWYMGQNAFLTCGHGLSVGTDIFYNGSQIGDVAYQQFANNEYGDYAFITLFDNVDITNRIKRNSGTTISITGTMSDVPIGTTCYKYGSVSNQESIVTVTNKNVEITYDKEGKTIKGLTVANIDSGSSVDGDSGGPYYLYKNGAWYFCGVHSGYEDSLNEVYFTPYYIFSGGFTIATS